MTLKTAAGFATAHRAAGTGRQHRGPGWLLAAAALVLAACTSPPERDLAERLRGSWQQEISVLGRPTVSVITFVEDGTFVERVRQRTAQGLMPMVDLPGRWRVKGGELHLEYLTGFTGQGGPATEVRRVSVLDGATFRSSDARFGIEVLRRRVAAP